MYLEASNLIGKKSRVLHIAPEKGLYKRISELVGKGNYVVGDYDPGRYAFVDDCRKIDLCNLDNWSANEFDIILHSHVLEHLPCNIAHTLFHLHRMLKPDGKHFFMIPISNGRYDECFQELDIDERCRRFGQADHMRHFGVEDLDLHIGKLLNLPSDFDATRDFSPGQLKNANIPEKFWRGLNPSTVFRLGKQDMLLLRNQR
jgi:phosphoglycolate phosphatase